MAEKTPEEIGSEVENMVHVGGLHEHSAMIKRGAFLHYYPDSIKEAVGGTEYSAHERESVTGEVHNRWKQPAMLYFLVTIGAMAAVAQGMDETVVNGAQLYFQREFGITHNQNIQGLVNSAPYLAAGLIGSFLSIPLNSFSGRRGTIFICMLITTGASFWEAFSPSWQQLLGARLLLGLGIGAASATVPVYTAECVPTPIRGGLTMFWQTFTAFGIMIGYIIDVAFVHIPNNWRMMMGSTFVVPLFVAALIYLVPESPRWLIKKKKYTQAYAALKLLRNSELLAARDLFSVEASLIAERKLVEGRNPAKEIFTVPRNRRATVAAWTVMFMQQFCGVNVIMYYSSQIFVNAGVSDTTAIYASLGAGVLNFIFAFPAIYLIDKAGRRPLLLWTFPAMSLCLLFTGFSFYAQSDNTRLVLVALGIYLFMIAYSPGEGPVPFVYAGEAFPLYVRSFGMSSATSVTWIFSFILGFTFPNLLKAFTPQGAFGFYAAWCALGWLLIFLLVPETKGLTLEQLDDVFNLPTTTHIKRAIAGIVGREIVSEKPEP
eukprot:Phypoly_transcript_05811.p1 GENE.Phypoly_transcript_05811~~Phypoly_transcript_05811.p1  ORF type:complete len:545 (+),score=68.22 Phypoly_transcript_05811:139-1773(+)